MSVTITARASNGATTSLVLADPVVNATAPVSLFTTQTPSQPNETDGAGSAGDYELGMRFSASVNGQITGIRYWKAASETGTHTGRIWSSTGTLLASVAFTGETASGWQTKALATPLNITAGTQYIVSVNVTSRYAATTSGFSSAVSNAGLTAPVGAGIFSGTPGSFPTASYSNTNYFRDVVFVPSAAAPPVDPPPVDPPPSGTLMGWQLTASNTGLAGAGVNRNTLPVYTGPEIVPAGTTITLKKITTGLLLHNGNITLDRCWIQPAASMGLSSLIFTYNPDNGNGPAGPVTIKDCDIDGSAVTSSLIYADCAVRGACNVLRCNIWGMGTGIAIYNSPAMPTQLIEGNFVHGLRGGVYAGQQSHNESATIRGFNGASCIWRNNKLESLTGSDSGALFIQTYAGPINNVLIEGNYFDSYGYDLPLEAAYGSSYSNMRANNNRFYYPPKGFGVGYVTGGPGWTQWTNNHYYDATKADAKGAVVGSP
jgi:hypothetical protein